MKKQLTLTTAMAAALAGCSSTNDWDDGNVYTDRDTAVCVDQNGQRVDDDRCDDNRYRAYGGGYVRYYIGRGAAIPFYGDSVRDGRYRGSYAPNAGATYYPAPSDTRITRSQAVSRGGLGSSSRSFGSGRS